MQDENSFAWGTLNDYFASNVMNKVFIVSKDDVIEHTQNVSDYDAYITVEAYNKDLGVNVTYEFTFKANKPKEYYLEKVVVDFSIDSKWYDFVVWGSNHYDVPAPPSK